MMNTQMTSGVADHDAELVRASLAGNREAFSRIVARYQSLVCSLAFSATGCVNASEDLAPDTFLTAWQQLGGLREPEKLRSWLCALARNVINNSLRRQGREPSHRAESLEAAPETLSPEPHPVEQAISREELAILWRSLERIPELYREPMVLFYRENQSVAVVAQNLELTEEAVKQRLSRGRKMLHEQVLAVVEGALARTNPGKAFTLAVVAALPALAGSAKAAALGSVAGGSAATPGASALNLMAWSQAKLAVCVGAGVLLAALGAATLVGQSPHPSGVVQVPQVHLKARFIEIPKDHAGLIAAFPGLNRATGILDPGAAGILVKALAAQPGGTILCQPEMVTVVNRSSELRVATVVEVITNRVWVDNAVVPQTGKIEFGPVLAVKPVLLHDGRIQLDITASVREFWGYADTSGLTPDYTNHSTGDPIALPIYLPAGQIQQAHPIAELADGQTLVLILPAAEPLSFSKLDAAGEQRVARQLAAAAQQRGATTTLVLVTLNLVDAAGNLVRDRAAGGNH
jgi:RNA polymerase sigma factor (sigma-70 family)